MRHRLVALTTAFFLGVALSSGHAGKGEAPKVGTKAPDFALTNVDGKRVKLSQYKGKKNVLLGFFPKSFTPG